MNCYCFYRIKAALAVLLLFIHHSFITAQATGDKLVFQDYRHPFMVRVGDVILMVPGTEGSVEKEGVDHPDLSLPGDQEDLAKSVFAANPRTIVVLQNGSALSLDWLKDNVPANVETW